MTYPKPGEIALTDPQTGDVEVLQYDHVDTYEHYVSCQMMSRPDGHGLTVETKMRYPWHRIVAVRHELTDSDDEHGGRVYAVPDSEDWDGSDDTEDE